MHEYVDVCYAIYAEQAFTMYAAAGVGADALTELEKRLEEPLPSEVSGDEMERQRRRRTAEENRVAHAKLQGFMQMPRKRELTELAGA